MTQPQAPSLVDAGNVRLTHDVETDLVLDKIDGATDMVLGKIPVLGGEKGIATIRQGNVTLTVPMGKAMAEQWADRFSRLAGVLSGGEKGIATIRQGNVTLTVPMDKATAEQWADLFGQLAGMLSGSGIAVASRTGLVAGTDGQVW